MWLAVACSMWPTPYRPLTDAMPMPGNGAKHQDSETPAGVPPWTPGRPTPAADAAAFMLAGRHAAGPLFGPMPWTPADNPPCPAPSLDGPTPRTARPADDPPPGRRCSMWPAVTDSSWLAVQVDPPDAQPTPC